MIIISISKKAIENNFHSCGVPSPYDLDEKIQKLREARWDLEVEYGF